MADKRKKFSLKILVVGEPAVGKTSVIIAFLEDTMLNHPDQKNFFRNPYFAPLQFLKLSPSHKWEIMLEEDSKVTFHDRDDRLREIDIDGKIRYFKDFQDLYDKATPGKCTSVFFEDEIKWYNHENDMRKYSKMFPKATFIVSGVGEEEGDYWKEYYKNGKMVRCNGDMTIAYDTFDERDYE